MDGFSIRIFLGVAVIVIMILMMILIITMRKKHEKEDKKIPANILNETISEEHEEED